MIWIISAILLGLILGVIGYYSSKAACGLLVAIFTTSTLFVPSEFLYFNFSGNIMHSDRSIAYLGRILAGLPEYIQWAGLLFVIFFFVARIITWFLARLNIIREVGTGVDGIQRGIEEYSYDPAAHDFYT